MGKYLNAVNGKELPNRGKADAILSLVPGSQEIKGTPAEYQPDLVCVVDNGAFEAAGYCFNEREFEAFTYPDSGGVQRPRRWLLVPDVEQLYEAQKHG